MILTYVAQQTTWRSVGAHKVLPLFLPMGRGASGEGQRRQEARGLGWLGLPVEIGPRPGERQF